MRAAPTLLLMGGAPPAPASCVLRSSLDALRLPPQSVCLGLPPRDTASQLFIFVTGVAPAPCCNPSAVVKVKGHALGVLRSSPGDNLAN